MKYLYGFVGTRGVARNPQVSGCGFVPVPVRVRVSRVRVRVGPRRPVPYPCATLVMKATIFTPCHSTITADSTATLYRNHVWKHFSLPHKLISDRGPQFTAAFTRDLCSLLNIDQALSMAYHPQSDGQTERVNQELEQYLHAYTSI